MLLQKMVVYWTVAQTEEYKWVVSCFNTMYCLTSLKLNLVSNF